MPIPNQARTNVHHMLKKKPMCIEDLAVFIACYNRKNRQKRKATWDEEKYPEGCWRNDPCEKPMA